MIWSIRKVVVLCVVPLLFCTCPVLCGATAAAKITDVKLSDDFRRLVIKGEGELGHPAISKMERPSKLIIDFEQCQLGDFPRHIRNEKKLLREIRVEKVRSGVRVVVDFGDHPIPEYRFSKIDDCYMVFFGDAQEEPPASPGRSRGYAVALNGSRATVPPRAAPAPTERHVGRVLIKRAQVVDGAIVLDVAGMNRPTEVYRVTLGLDFSKPGFRTAAITRVSSPARTTGRTTQTRSRSPEAPSASKLIRGPMKAAADGTSRPGARGPTKSGAYCVTQAKEPELGQPAGGLNLVPAAYKVLVGDSH